jgi:hypothetical protein
VQPRYLLATRRDDKASVRRGVRRGRRGPGASASVWLTDVRLSRSGRIFRLFITRFSEASKGVHQIIKAGAKLRQIISKAGCGPEPSWVEPREKKWGFAHRRGSLRAPAHAPPRVLHCLVSSGTMMVWSEMRGRVWSV